jgi:hypothetical protein
MWVLTSIAKAKRALTVNVAGDVHVMQAEFLATSTDCISLGMAYDEWEHEYHLTTHGWLSGSFFFRGTLAKKIVVPSDRVMTIVQENMHSSVDAALRTTWRCDWKSSDHGAEEVDLLIRLYGHRPPSGITAPISNLMAKSSHARV